MKKGAIIFVIALTCIAGLGVTWLAIKILITMVRIFLMIPYL